MLRIALPRGSSIWWPVLMTYVWCWVLAGSQHRAGAGTRLGSLHLFFFLSSPPLSASLRRAPDRKWRTTPKGSDDSVSHCLVFAATDSCALSGVLLCLPSLVPAAAECEATDSIIRWWFNGHASVHLTVSKNSLHFQVLIGHISCPVIMFVQQPFLIYCCTYIVTHTCLAPHSKDIEEC